MLAQSQTEISAYQHRWHVDWTKEIVGVNTDLQNNLCVCFCTTAEYGRSDRSSAASLSCQADCWWQPAGSHPNSSAKAKNNPLELPPLPSWPVAGTDSRAPAMLDAVSRRLAATASSLSDQHPCHVKVLFIRLLECAREGLECLFPCMRGWKTTNTFTLAWILIFCTQKLEKMVFSDSCQCYSLIVLVGFDHPINAVIVCQREMIIETCRRQQPQTTCYWFKLSLGRPGQSHDWWCTLTRYCCHHA